MASSLSPPATPPSPRAHPSTPPLPSSSPASDDSEFIEDLSFDYIFDIDGNFVRTSTKGAPSASKSRRESSSPATTEESFQAAVKDILGPLSPPSLVSPPAHTRRSSLSRSESYSAPNVLAPPPPLPSQSVSQARSFQRVASVPASVVAPLGHASSLRAMRPLARRVTSEDRESNQDPRNAGSGRVPVIDEHQQEEKENLGGVAGTRPLSFPLPATHQDEVAYVPTTSTPGPPSTKLQGPTRLVSTVRPRVDAYAGTAGRQQQAGVQRSQSQTQRGPQRVTRSAVSFGKVETIKPTEPDEDTDIDDELIVNYETSSLEPLTRSRTHGSGSLGHSGNTRPRRSASLSDAFAHEPEPPVQYQSQNANNQSQSQSRPGTSLGFSTEGAPVNGDGPRRVMLDERERHGDAMKRHRREAEEAERRAQLQAQAHADELHQGQQYQPQRQSPSPTDNPQSYLQRPLLNAHKRRDSDTLRSIPHPPLAGLSGSPSAPIPPVARLSPSARGLQASSSAPAPVSAKHRRSGTAPEQQTTSGMLAPPGPSAPLGKTWNGERERESEREQQQRERGRPQQQQTHQQLQQQQQQLQQLHQQQQQQQQQQHLQQQQQQYNQIQGPVPIVGGRTFIVNRKPYARLDMIGKGGTSRVFRVLSNANELYAIKRVSLDKTDAETMNGYMNEIALLKRLDGNHRIIRLIDSEVKAGPGGSKGHLFLVMECGEIDFARLMSDQMKEPMNMVWVAYYWQQMLQAVHVIHEEKIVHSDLKPANFVLVRGQLKLIDFGIANAIANDTTNIQRDHQIGTVNYMSPEAIELPEGMRRLKVGRPSDVWSLGIILYQMIYGHPPFQHLSVYQKMKAIPDLEYAIDFPEFAAPSLPAPPKQGSSRPSTPPKKLDHLKRPVRSDVIASMKSCLCRNPKERAMIPELLEQDWLAMKEPPAPVVKELLGKDETVINPYFMQQLLSYGIGLGKSNTHSDPEVLLKEAERLVAELKSIQ
ncbi:other/TTK protein kinase [Mycena rebaudengoi]|nr:other/TTK protein kinase [Mycena rebaudengoi]